MLSVQESLSRTRMWNKSVEIPQTKVHLVGQTKFGAVTYPAGPRASDFDSDDPGFLGVVSPPLEKAYLDILGKAWTYLDPEEMRTVKAQAAELRAKTTFQGKREGGRGQTASGRATAPRIQDYLLGSELVRSRTTPRSRVCIGLGRTGYSTHSRARPLA